MQDLGAAGRVVRFEAAPPPGYRCLLDAQPDTWVPGELRAPPRVARGDWIVNPSLHFSQSGEPVGDPAFCHALMTPAPTAWVTDPITGLLAPFAVSASLASLLARLEPGALLAQSVPDESASLLHAAGIVFDPADVQRERSQWQARLAAAARQFRDGYSALGNLLHPFALGATRVYFRRLIRQGGARLGDDQSERR